MNREQRDRLVEVLLKIRTLEDPKLREDVVSDLPPEIKSGIQPGSTPRAHVNHIVDRCADFPGGIDEFLRVLRESYEGNSLPMQAAEKTWNEIQEDIEAAASKQAASNDPDSGSATASPEPAGQTAISGAENIRIFLSYKCDVEPDERIALEVQRELKSRGYYVFVDKDMPVGAEWGRRIDEEIRQAHFLIPILSEHSVNSEMVLAEIEKAYHLAKEHNGRPRTLPVRLNYREPFRYPLSAYLNHLNWVLWKGEADTPRLAEQLLRAIAGEALPGTRAEEEIRSEKADTGLPAPHYAAQPHLEMPEGTMDPESRFYIERNSDRIALDAIAQQGVTITIKAPRQMGKSSLLIRTLRAAEKAGKKTVFLDFQLFDKQTLETADSFFKQFIAWLTDELGLEDRVEAYWKPGLSKPLCCTRYLEQYILKTAPLPLLLALDEVDIILDRPYRSDFFGMLRSWYNKRQSGSVWKNLDLALVTSTEPYQLIEKLTQSPFNVGTVIELNDFDAGQMAELNRRHGNPFKPHLIGQLMELLHGHPYLVRRALFWVAGGQGSAEELFRRAIENRGPFGDHLRYHLFRLHNRKELVHAFLQIIQRQSCEDEDLFFRLEAAGLVRKEGGKTLPRCRLYAEYFKERLHDG